MTIVALAVVLILGAITGVLLYLGTKGGKSTTDPSTGPSAGRSGVFLKGGWCQCAYGNRPTFDPARSNIIIAGGFQGDSNIGPFCNDTYTCDWTTGNEVMEEYHTKWLGVGGYNVGTDQQYKDLGSCLSKATSHANGFDDITGIAFDMEGCVGERAQNAENILSWIEQQEGLSKNTKKILVVLPSFIGTKQLYDKFDYVAPMMYGGPNSYNDVVSTSSLIEGWLENYKSLISNHKLFITYQTDSLFTCGWEQNKISSVRPSGKQILAALAKKAYDGGYAGILGWPSVLFEGQGQNTFGLPTTVLEQQERQKNAEDAINEALGVFLD